MRTTLLFPATPLDEVATQSAKTSAWRRADDPPGAWDQTVEGDRPGQDSERRLADAPPQGPGDRVLGAVAAGQPGRRTVKDTPLLRVMGVGEVCCQAVDADGPGFAVCPSYLPVRWWRPQ